MSEERWGEYLPAVKEAVALSEEQAVLAQMNRELERAGMDCFLLDKPAYIALEKRKERLRAHGKQMLGEMEAVEDERLKALIWGRYVEGLEWEKLAEKLDKSVNWVYWKWRRAFPKNQKEAENRGRDEGNSGRAPCGEGGGKNSVWGK